MFWFYIGSLVLLETQNIFGKFVEEKINGDTRVETKFLLGLKIKLNNIFYTYI